MTKDQAESTGSTATINAVDIARLAGVGRAAVSNWRKRYEDFPEPVAGTVSSPLFDAGQVRAWLRDQGKLKELPLGDELWRALDLLRGVADLGEVLVLFAMALRYLRTRETTLVDDLDAEVLADDAAFVAAVAERAVGEDPDRVVGIAQPDSTWAPVLRLLDRTSDDLPAFERLVHSWVDRGGRRGSPGTASAELAELMFTLADGSTVLDPFCHVGELLRAAARDGTRDVSLVGQHPDQQEARLAAALLWLDTEEPPRIAVGDGLRADSFSGEMFDSVLCLPPWGSRDWGFDELQFDPRWEYGLPPRPAGELAWVQHALSHLDTDGVAVLALPAAVGTQARGRRIRAELIRRGALRAVIALPPGVVSGTAIPTVLWLLRSPSSSVPPPGGVLMVDGSGLRVGRGVDWAGLSELVVPVWREFDESGKCEEQPGTCGVVSAINLLDDEVNLTPARHLSVAAETDVDGIRATRGRLLDVLAQVPELVPEVTARTEPPGPSTTVNELSRIGALEVLHQSGSAAKAEQEGVFTALTSRDVIKGRAPSGSGGALGTREPIWLRPGDVVLPMIGGHVRSRVIEDEQAVLGANLWLLRVNQEQLDPWFVAGFLRNSVNATLTSGSMTARLDVRQVELPRIPLAEQRGYARAFHRLFVLEDRLRRIEEDGGDLITAMIDGLTNNGLQPPEGD